MTTYSPSAHPCDECGGPTRGSDSGHGICLYCRLPDLLDQQLFMVRESVLKVCDDPAVVVALASHRAPDYDLGFPVLRPGDTCVSPDRTTMAQVAFLEGLLHIGVATRVSTSDTWPRKEWLALEGPS